MAGHSKWANTKHRKAAQDTKRDKIFTKIIRELSTAVRLGNGDPALNPRLRAAVDKALSNNMARDTLNRVIMRGISSNNKNTKMINIIYEGYGPGGTAILVDCMSDNRNRTAAEIRYAFNKGGGNLGIEGSVSYLFNKMGVILFKNGNEDAILAAAIKAGAENLVTHDDGTIDIYTKWEELNAVQKILEAANLKPDNTKISMIPFTKTDLDIETTLKLLHLINMLANCEDVREVYHNGNISNEVSINCNA